MRDLHPTVKECFQRYRQPGTVALQVTVEANGLASASVVGAFRGSDTGSCIVEVACRDCGFSNFRAHPLRLSTRFG